MDCPDTGTVWSPEATATTCSITFFRSTASGDDADGDARTPPTVTMTATATWTASWTSSLNATPTPLDSQTQETTTQIAVAEIQALVTR